MDSSKVTQVPIPWICKFEGCNCNRSGSSKYCYEHKVIARRKFQEMVSQQNEERTERYAEFETIWSDAWANAMRAGDEAKPLPMVVCDPSAGREYHVPDGPCGFAWVIVKPGNSSFAHWLKKKGHARRDSYYGGVTIWIDAFNQSHERKSTAAHVLAKELGAAFPKLRIYSMSRLD